MGLNIKSFENNDKEENKNGLFDLKAKPNWPYLIFTVVIHLVGLYGFINFPYLSSKMTFLWCKYILI